MKAGNNLWVKNGWRERVQEQIPDTGEHLTRGVITSSVETSWNLRG